MGKATLTPVIKVDGEKCVNCFACINICPAKFCIDGSGDKLEINPDLCIGCGNCITTCVRNAREFIDDTSHFLGDLKRSDKMIAVVAPAVASVFPKQFLNMNGFLKSLGIEAIFDVSFGAELTVVSYLEHLTKNNPRLIIAQPCPAIVTFLEIFHPKLLQYLAPVDSPMLHTIRMIREYYPQYKNHKIAVISPCIAKRREFDETGLGDYNVTMLSLKKYFEAHNINLASFPEVEYIGPSAERAVRFSSPGGLLDTAERFVPGIRRRTRKIEGIHSIYPYLEELNDLVDTNIKLSPLVDCLNCEKGCNGGPGTGNSRKPLVVLENPVRERSAQLESYHMGEKGEWKYSKKYHKLLKKYCKPGLYKRVYRDLSNNNHIKTPNSTELTAVYRRLKKFSEADLYNCTGCGYGSCEKMATAIFNNLNKPENCIHYKMIGLEEKQKQMKEVNDLLGVHIKSSYELIEGINSMVNNLNTQVNSQATAVDVSSKVTEKMVASIKSTSEHSQEKQLFIRGMIQNAARGQESMKDTIQSVQGISESVEGIASAIKIISTIAANTNLLAMNAAIEAAHAGDAGRGFAVVADEIRRLSETTRENSQNISKTLSNIIEGITVTSKRSGDTNNLITDMAKEINSFAGTMTELINTFNELSTGSSEITVSLGGLRELSTAVKSGYAEMFSMTEKLRSDMTNLAKVAGQM